MKHFILISTSFLLLLNLTACAGFNRYQEGLVIKGEVQVDTAKNIAKNSTGILDFASKIYKSKSEPSRNDRHFTDTRLEESLNYNLDDLQFYKVYCGEKKGEMYEWKYGINAIAYSNIGGDGKKIISCESNGKVDAAMFYEQFRVSRKYYPYHADITYATEDYLKKYLEKNQLYGYQSSNGMIVFPATRLNVEMYHGGSIPKSYAMTFNYENKSTKPVVIDLANSQVIVNGQTYDLVFKNGKLTGGTRFDLDKGNRAYAQNCKFKFNPGQIFKGEIIFEIPGLQIMTEEDMKNTVFVIDGVKCKNFKKVDYFSLNKEPVKK